MKHFINILSLLFIIHWTTNAQWVQTNRPQGGRIRSLTTHENKIFAGTSDGSLYVTTNEGASWSPISNGLPGGSSIDCIVVDPMGPSMVYIFAGTRGYGLFLSTDMGMNWQPSNNGITNTFIVSLTISKGTNGESTIFAGSYGTIYRSTNHGTSWLGTPVSSDLYEINSLVVEPTDSGNPVVFAGLRGVFLTTDYGLTWHETGTKITNVINTLAIFKSDSGKVNLLAGTSSGIFLTTNRGASWQAMNNGLTNNYVLELVICDSNIFASTWDGIFRLTVGTTTWQAVNNGLPDRNAEALAAKDTVVFAGTLYTGVYRSTSYGESWFSMNNGITSLELTCMAIMGSEMFLGTYGCGVYISTDRGGKWDSLWDDVMIPHPVTIVSVDSTVFAGGGGIIRSTDDGRYWQYVSDGLTGGDVNVLAVDDTNVFTGTDEGIFRTTNLGTYWQYLGPDYSLNDIYSLAVDDSDIFAARSLWGGIYHSNNYGTSWQIVDSGLTNQYLRAIAINRPHIFAGTVDGAFLSIDNGTSWRSINNGLTNRSITSYLVYKLKVFTGTGSGVFLTEDQGESWRNVSGNLCGKRAKLLALDDSDMFVLSDRRIWRRPITEMITSINFPDSKSNLPGDYVLKQNYPNPFNSSTIINYRLPIPSFVTIKVFDVLGREVATLVSGIEQPGYKSVNYNARSLASGVYYYRLRAGNYIETKKLLLLR